MRAKDRRGERGQATVEFAIVLPLVLLLVVGLIEFGKGFNYWISLNHIANETARWAAVDKLPPTTFAPTNQELKQYAVAQVNTEELKNTVAPNGNLDNVTVCFTPTFGTTPQIGDAVTVAVRAPYSFPLVSSVVNFAASLFGGDGTGIGDVMLTGTSTVRLEQVPDPTGWTECS